MSRRYHIGLWRDEDSDMPSSLEVISENLCDAVTKVREMVREAGDADNWDCIGLHHSVEIDNKWYRVNIDERGEYIIEEKEIREEGKRYV